MEYMSLPHEKSPAPHPGCPLALPLFPHPLLLPGRPLMGLTLQPPPLPHLVQPAEHDHRLTCKLCLNFGDCVFMCFQSLTFQSNTPLLHDMEHVTWHISSDCIIFRHLTHLVAGGSLWCPKHSKQPCYCSLRLLPVSTRKTN